ncbi:MAG: hypothetical protein HY809_10540 [Nitrospirae bacterium]|nr:hypothetical protein [Nitrospirota bacterium]
MRILKFALLFALSAILGCASPGIDEARIKQLETELRKEFRDQIDASRKELIDEAKKDNQVLDSKINSLKEESQAGLAELKEIHERDNIELQKGVLGNKRLIDEQAKRIYLIESIVTSKASSDKDTAEDGFVTYVDGINISISMGSADGMRPGDIFGIYSGNEKIASGKAVKVETNSSVGMVISKDKEITLGNSVRPEKKK